MMISTYLDVCPCRYGRIKPYTERSIILKILTLFSLYPFFKNVIFSHEFVREFFFVYKFMYEFMCEFVKEFFTNFVHEFMYELANSYEFFK